MKKLFKNILDFYIIIYMEVPEKIKVSDLRKEIGEHKKSLFKNVAVMRSDDLRKYLDELRLASNLIDAKQAQNKLGPTMPQHKEHHEEPKHEKTEIDTESESEKEEKKIIKKVEKKVKQVEQEFKREKHLKPKEVEKEHKAEKKHLEEIPKELKAMVKKHMKEHPDHSEKMALSKVKKALFKVLS
jgi:hypothetical protein